MVNSNFINFTIETSVDGERRTFNVLHPKVSEGREDAVRRFLGLGCELIPKVERLPNWLSQVPPQFQASLLKLKPELFDFYQLRIPEAEKLTSEDWASLINLPEIQHLSVSSEHLIPSHMAELKHLKKLEFLVFHIPFFDDSFCVDAPFLPSVRMVDVIGTSLTPKGFELLKKAFPNSKIYT